jgi:hypothetical protein
VPQRRAHRSADDTVTILFNNIDFGQPDGNTAWE